MASLLQRIPRSLPSTIRLITNRINTLTPAPSIITPNNNNNNISPAAARFPFSTCSRLLSNPISWKLGRLNHVALVVPDLDASTAMYRDVLGASVSVPEDLPEHGVTVVFVDLGNVKIELLHPLSPESPVANFLKKNKSGGMHHVCIEVDDIREAMKDLKAKNVRLLSEEAKIGAHGNPVVFLHPKDCNGVLTELEQVPK